MRSSQPSQRSQRRRARRSARLPGILTLLALFALALPGSLACGSDEGSRGLQPSDETSTPASDAEDAMTEAERRKQQAHDIQSAEIEEFDHAEDE